jgi:hypothetical protein
MSIEFDFSEMNQLTAVLGAAPVKMIPFIRKAVEVTARNVKDDWQSDIPSIQSRGSRAYKSSVDYTMVLDTDGSIGADIGPNLGRAGGSFGFLEDAPGGVTSAPQHSGRKAAKKNEADFMDGLAKAGEDALG